MVKRQRASSATLFLMELIVSVMYFALAATLCIAIFVRAHVMSTEAKDLNAAANMASDCAELIRSRDSLEAVNKSFVSLYPEALISNTETGTIVMIYFDENRDPCGANGAYYLTEVRMADEEGLITADITVSDSKEREIFSLSVNHATPPSGQ